MGMTKEDLKKIEPQVKVCEKEFSRLVKKFGEFIVMRAYNRRVVKRKKERELKQVIQEKKEQLKVLERQLSK